MNGVTDALPLAVIALLIDLESRDIRVTVGDDGDELMVEPPASLTAADRLVIENHFDAFFLGAAFATDRGVRVRVRAFANRTSSNCLVPDAFYAVGRCFSCGCESGGRHPRPRRCWRCRVAWQLAMAMETPSIAGLAAQSHVELEHVESCG